MDQKKASAILSILSITIILLTCQVSANPSYTPGVWKKINPPGIPFNGPCCGGTSFAQGIAVDPSNPSIIYLCVNNFDVASAGLYKSTDGGSNWNRIGNLPVPLFQGATTIIDEPLRIRIDPNNPQHLYCGDGVRGSSIGFWISNDGGATFSIPAAFKAYNALDVYDIAVEPGNFNHVLVSFHGPFPNKSDAGVMESTDGGTTWIVHDPISGWGAGHGIAFLNNSSTWLLGTQGNGCWRTTNSGANWTQVTTENIAHGGNQVYRAGTGVWYASSGNKVLRSTDNGATWTGVGSAVFSTSVFGDGQYLYTHKAYAGPSEPFSVSLETSGTTWSNLTSAGSFENGPFEMAFDATNRILYSGNWGDGLIAMKLPGSAIARASRKIASAHVFTEKKLTMANGRLMLAQAPAQQGAAVALYTITGKFSGFAAKNHKGDVR